MMLPAMEIARVMPTRPQSQPSDLASPKPRTPEKEASFTAELRRAAEKRKSADTEPKSRSADEASPTKPKPTEKAQADEAAEPVAETSQEPEEDQAPIDADEDASAAASAVVSEAQPEPQSQPMAELLPETVTAAASEPEMASAVAAIAAPVTAKPSSPAGSISNPSSATAAKTAVPETAAAAAAGAAMPPPPTSSGHAPLSGGEAPPQDGAEHSAKAMTAETGPHPSAMVSPTAGEARETPVAQPSVHQDNAVLKQLQPVTPQPHPGMADEPTTDVNAARVARGLQNAVNQHGGSVTLRLTPVELGTVRIQMQLQGTNVSAQFFTETDAAQTTLHQQLSQLRQALEGQGLTVDRLQVQTMQSGSSGQMNSGNQQHPDGAPHDGRSRGFPGSEQGRQQGGGEQGGRDPRRRGAFSHVLANQEN